MGDSPAGAFEEHPHVGMATWSVVELRAVAARHAGVPPWVPEAGTRWCYASTDADAAAAQASELNRLAPGAARVVCTTYESVADYCRGGPAQAGELHLEGLGGRAR